jgi:hypothetical protein
MQPWKRKVPQFQFVAPEVESETGDHPAVMAGWELPNSNTNVTNFLFHIVDSREFWSVFTAIILGYTRPRAIKYAKELIDEEQAKFHSRSAGGLPRNNKASPGSARHSFPTVISADRRRG